MMRLELLIVLGVALSALGCAEQLQLLDRGPVGGVSPCSFWPPPPSSTTWLATPSRPSESLSDVAGQLELSLHEGGYSQQRWYPIGVGQSHGFAVTTRLEQVEDEAQRSSRARWSSLYADAASLRWLAQARTPTLPSPGRYRVFLIAYTDLPIGRTSNAPTWNEETIMDWPDAPDASSPRVLATAAPASKRYRLAIYEYEYRWNEVEDRGSLVPLRAAAAREKSPPLATVLAARGFTPSAAEPLLGERGSD